MPQKKNNTRPRSISSIDSAKTLPSKAIDAKEHLDIAEMLVRRPATTFFVRVEGDGLPGSGVEPGDILVADLSVKAGVGDIAIENDGGEYKIRVVEFGEPVPFATVLWVIHNQRPTRSRAKKSKAPQSESKATESDTPAIAHLRAQLARLERVPENEATRFHLESEIYRTEREVDDEWPDLIAA